MPNGVEYASMRHLSLLLLTVLLTSCLTRQDSLAPIITIYSPPSGSVQSSEAPNVFGYVMDDEGIRSLKVGNLELLNEDAYKAERGKKLIHFGFKPRAQSEGVFAADIVVEDRSGKVTSKRYEVSIDRTPPTVELLSVTNLSGSRLRVVGIARDNIAVKSIVIAGVVVPLVPSPEHNFSVDITQSDNMTIDISDQAGNEISEAIVR